MGGWGNRNMWRMNKEGDTGEGGRQLEVRFLRLEGLLIIRIEKEQDWDESYNWATGRM